MQFSTADLSPNFKNRHHNEYLRHHNEYIIMTKKGIIMNFWFGMIPAVSSKKI